MVIFLTSLLAIVLVWILQKYPEKACFLLIIFVTFLHFSIMLPQAKPFLYLAEIAWIILAAFFGMNIADMNALERKSGKLALFFVFLTGSLIFKSYEGILISHLTVSSNNAPFTSPEELITSGFQ